MVNLVVLVVRVVIVKARSKYSRLLDPDVPEKTSRCRSISTRDCRAM